jgi:DNA-directed RNA polymerase subunit F
MKNSSVRNITMFVVVLGAGIYFFRPVGSSPVGVAFESSKPPVALKASSNSLTAQKNVSSKPTLVPRAPSSTGVATAAKLPSAANALSEKDRLISELRSLQKCYASQSCNFPKSDPRSYDFALGRKIAEDLKLLQKNFAKDFPEEARAIANEFSSNEDGFVQEAALDILHDLPASRESLKAVAHVVTETTDPSIIPQALDELKRYVGTNEEAQVHQALGRVLSTGGMLTSQKASQGLLPFLNANSVGYYQKVLKSLAPDSEVARNLKVSLIEYQRMSTGG